MESSYLGSSEQPLGQVTESDRLLAVLSHVLTLFFSFVAPLIIYLIKKDESPFVREHAKESLNFQITLAIAYIVSFILMIVLIGILMLMVIGVVHLVLVIVATVKAAENKMYRYPFCIRLIR
ncbi:MULTISPECIES: DUF4870 domain-containing protein [Chitinophagaceae]|uniref:DUF4870 domain-containing protein n=1 Tax=Chitinophagaceae TaxID=563835 RepID=UPI000DEEAB85|nr:MULTISPECIES: DUF4870 domain-containing protein [Chitinophagaceae]RPD47446.1 DUF4870 domain-containing protein [Paracnuella aquatica]